MKKRFRIIIISFSLSVIIMSALSFFSVDRFAALTNYSTSVDHTNKVIEQLFLLEGVVKDLDRIERGYMLTKDTSYARSLFSTVQKITPTIDSLKELTKDNDIERRNVVLVKSSLAIRLSDIRDNFSYLDTARVAGISPYYTLGHNAMQECMKTIRDMQVQENALMAEQLRNKNFYQQLTSSTLKYILGAFCIIIIISFILIIKEFKKRVAYQEELQAKIIELKHSHAELEQIAYAASHDLQEPLRKIQVFGNRLVWLKNEDIDDDSRHTMERITLAANRMQELIEDLVNITNLSKQNLEKEPVDLNNVIKFTLSDLEEKIVEKNASINFEHLPVVSGYPGQLKILFKALLDNALKFSKDGVPPVVQIKTQLVNTLPTGTPSSQGKFPAKKYYRIDIADNGIGFDNKFSHKLFQMFQRLHNQQSEYNGKGIGLTMSQRIMANHNGFIEATGHHKTGATFKLFFPID